MQGNKVLAQQAATRCRFPCDGIVRIPADIGQPQPPRRKDGAGATLVVALFPADLMDGLTNTVRGCAVAQTGRPQGSPLRRQVGLQLHAGRLLRAGIRLGQETMRSS